MSPFGKATADVLLALAPEPNAGRRARRALHAARLPEDLRYTVDLLATELIANAVRHARLRPDQQIMFAASFVPDFIRVEVADPGSGFDVETAMAGKGLGLRTVDKLASRWGVESDHGTRVWFEIDRRPQRFARD